MPTPQPQSGTQTPPPPLDFSDLGAKTVSTPSGGGTLDFSDLGAKSISPNAAPKGTSSTLPAITKRATGPTTADFRAANAARPLWKTVLGLPPTLEDFQHVGLKTQPAPGQIAPTDQEDALRNVISDPNESYGALQPLIGGAKGALSTGRNILSFLSPVHIRTIPTPGAPAPTDPLAPTNDLQQIGKTIEQGAEFLVPGKAVSALGKGGDALLAASKLPQFLQTAGRIGLRAGLEGGSAALVSKAQGENAKSSAETGAIGGGASQVLSESARVLSPWLKNIAAAQYNRFLAPTKETTKAIAKKIVPELLERGQVATSAEQLAERAANEAQPVGQQITHEVANLPGNPPYTGPLPQPLSKNAQNVVDKLEQYKQRFQVNGVPVNTDAMQHASDLQDIVRQLGPDVSPQSLNRVRQILDEGVSRSGGYAGKTLAEGSQLDAQKEAANAMRAELAKASPDIAKLNAEYTFWRRVQDVAGQTAKRQTGQQGGLTRVLAPLIGAGAGFATHGAWQEGVAGAAAMTLGNEIIKSPLYRTMSAITKSKLADALASGDVTTVAQIATRLSAGTASRLPLPAPSPVVAGATPSASQ